MHKFIVAAIALAAISVSVPASAQHRERPCGVQFTGSGQRVQTNHLVGPCDTGPDQSGHNGSRGRYFIGGANAAPYRQPVMTAYAQPEYGVVQQGYRQQSGGSTRFSSSQRTSIRQTRRSNTAAPTITGKMPTIDPKTLSREAYRVLGPVEVPPGVGYHFAVTANANDAPKEGCKVIKTGQSADGMYTLTRRICPK